MRFEMAIFAVHSQLRISLRQTCHTLDRPIPTKWRNQFSHTIPSSVDVVKPIGKYHGVGQGFVLCVAHMLLFEMIDDTPFQSVGYLCLCGVSPACDITYDSYTTYTCSSFPVYFPP